MAVAALAAGCSASNERTEGTGGAADAGDGWTELVGSDWTLAPGAEKYQCTQITVAQDTWVSAFRGIAPPGTHHTFLTSDSSATDGTFPCDGGTMGLALVAATAVGTPDFALPEGVAIKLSAGQKLLLNIHLLDASASPMSGHSGVAVRTVGATPVLHEAEAVLAGKTAGLTVPPGMSTQSGHCTMAADVTLFAVFPHMHKLGTHMTVTAAPANGMPTTLSDRPYAFGNQFIYPLSPTAALRSGDVVTVDCSYDNPGPQTVVFGQSTRDEMCFAALFRYPRVAHGVLCTL